MIRIKDVDLTKKILFMILFMVIISNLYSFYSFNSLTSENLQLHNLNKILVNMQITRMLAFDHFSQDEQEQLEKIEWDIQNKNQIIDETLEKLHQTADDAIVSEFHKKWDAYLEQLKNSLEMSRNYLKEDAFQEESTTGLDAFIKPQKILNGIISKYSIADEKELQKRIIKLFFISVTFGLAIAVLIFFFSTKALVKPLKKLVDASQKIAFGEFGYRITLDSNDEIGRLAKYFNKMSQSIQEKVELINNKMDDLQKLNAIGNILASSYDKTEILSTALKALKEKIKVERGSTYLLNEAGKMVLHACYPLAKDSDLKSNPRQFELAEGVAGKVAQQAKIIYIPDSTKSSDYITQSGEKPKSLLCVPLIDEKKVIGIMNFSADLGQMAFEKSDEDFILTIANMMVISLKTINLMSLLEEHNRTLEHKVKERTAAIKDLMDNTGQGFLTFQPDYKIDPEYSKPCEHFFKGPINDLDALDVMFATPHLDATEYRKHLEQGDLKNFIKHPDLVKELFEMIFTEGRELDLVEEILPKEIIMDETILAVEYRLILTAENKKIMVILTDVTKERELAAQIEADEELNTMIIKVALDRDGFIQALQEIHNLFLSIYHLLEQPADEIDPNELFRYYHTIKGGTASYGLKKVAVKTHEIEANLELIRSGEATLTQDLILKLSDETKEAEKVLNESLSELSAIISEEEYRQTERVYRIQESKIGDIKNFLISKLPDDALEIVQKAIKKLCMQPIGPRLQKYAIAAKDLADQLNKQIKVELRGKDIEVSVVQLEHFFGTLIHLVRNCVDHGLEDTEIRGMLGKSEIGTIIIEAVEENDFLKLIIADDGGGIDPETIKNIAIEKGIVEEKQLESFSEEDVIKLIFAPGFSTKEQVSEVSGRGVGMDAVKAAVEELGGEIQIKTELDLGTTFEITIPNAA